MELVATTQVPGWVGGKFHDFSTDEILPSQAVDRLEEDSALLSRAIVELHKLHHYPLIAAADYRMSVIASADTVTLADNVQFAVGGVIFSTHWLDSRAVAIPDNSTRFLRAEVDETCGDLVDYGDPANGIQVDPLTRKLVCKLLLVEGAETDPEGMGGGPSSPTSMRILKAVKGAAGTVPTITVYGNDGRNPNMLLIVPYAGLDYPTVCTSDNLAGVSGQAAVAGGKVRLPAGVTITLGEGAAGMGRMLAFVTEDWLSADLNANSTYYVRGQVAANGTLLLYTAKGTDSDVIPAGLKGVANAAAGGGFDSTVLDILLAKVVTGAAGSSPAVTQCCNAKLLTAEVAMASNAAYTLRADGYGEFTATVPINWGRRPRLCAVSGFFGFNSSNNIAMQGHANSITKSYTRYALQATVGSDWGSAGDTVTSVAEIKFSVMA